ncbi:unnamed protein product [Allacma fusca]|uniref:BTB domain-containing protein n=1 Tax=Allacma fusca TaxID=39272 RepID=A0A8J2PCH7_9HEXA|nr:unnamed protein product [Allacma fusca]
MASGPLLEDMECTERCRSFQHGQEICAIGTKGTDLGVLSLWKSTCMKYHKIKDEFGRTALHIASSTGRPKVVEWLVKREGCDVNVKDLSGYTPLHRSIYFGHLDCARTLIRLDASLNIGDNEGYFPLDLCRVDSPLSLKSDEVSRGPNEVYVWGSNENYNLGTGSEQPKITPELLDKSRKMPWGHLGSCFIQVALERYHTLFLHWSNHVYSCGYGVGGRLGLGNEFTGFMPAKIELGKDSLCMKVAVGPDHSLFLLNSGVVKSCGLNENFVLGQSHAMNKVFQPKHVDISTKIIDIAASRLHSVFLTEDDVYVCGVNIGQMLKPENIDKVVKPTKVVFPFDLDPRSNRSGHKLKFSHVACTESATAVAHTGGNIFILKNYDCITLNTRHMDIQKIQLVGGHSNTSWNRDKNSQADSEGASQAPVKLSMFVLIQTGRLLIWREGVDQSSTPNKGQNKNSSASHFNLAVFNVGRAVTIQDFSASLNSIILINQTGEGFKALWNASLTPTCYSSRNSSASKSSKAVNQWSYVIQQSARHNTGKDPFSNMMLEQIKVKRIPNIYTGIAAFCDPRGNNFAITQRHQKADQVILPMTMPSEISRDFGDLLKEASCEDGVHDVVFQVRKSLFPAHRFIVASRCKNLYDQIFKDLNGLTDRAPRIVIKDVEPRVFEQILQYLYTNDCDMTTSGKFMYSPDDPDWLELLKVYSRKLGLNDLNKRLKMVHLENGENRSTCSRAKDVQFSWDVRPELYDVDLISDNGIQIKAHLCVLVARLEYFKSMLLSNFWLEGTKAEKQLKFPSSEVVMNIFMKLLYEGKVFYENTGTRKDLEVLSQALIATDLLLSQQYRSEIEFLLADCINLETVSEIIQLADVCNAPQIKESCMEFIVLNMAPLLENRYLDSLPEEMMQEVSNYYRGTFTSIQIRKIKDTTAPVGSAYKHAEEKYGEYFEDLDNIATSDYVTPRKSQQSKAKIKLPSRNRNLSSCSNQEIEGNNSISLDDDEVDVDDLTGSLHAARNSYDKSFTVVTKHKNSTQTPPPSKQLPAAATPIRIKIPIPSKNFKLPDTPEEKPTPLTPRQTGGAHKYSIPLKMSDFPSFSDTFKNQQSNVETLGNVENSPPDRGKSTPSNTKLVQPNTREAVSSNGIASSGSSRRKTKWVSLDAVAKSPKTTVASTVPSTSPNSWSRDPKNPWERLSATKKNSKGESTNGNMNFDEILQQEERKKENLQKALEKPLQLSQIEDEAINQLLKRYTSQDVLDGYETLTVELVSAKNEYAIPVWRKVTDNPID